jgi:signal transduction histidine kinase/ActR/RegA family two-component response regulator
MLPPGLTEEAAPRVRFAVRSAAVAIGFGTVSAGLYALTGIWSQVVLASSFAVWGLTFLWLNRRGTSFPLLAHLSLLVCSLSFGLGALAQHPADYSSLALLILVPLMGRFMVGPRHSVPWVVGSVVWAAAVTIAVDQGWLLDFHDPLPTVSHVENLTIGLIIAWLLASSHDGVGAEALEHLRATDRSRRAFLATISHEIRTPMNGVLGMTEVLLQEPLAPEHLDQLAIIQRSGRRLVSLINDLLDISKMEAGKLSLEAADFSLDTVLADVEALTVPVAAQKGLGLTFRKGAEVPDWLRGDGLRLGQVLTNLLSNAVKFTAVGEVRLEVDREGGPGPLRVRFTVTDTGVGIAPEAVPRLFAAFQQGDSSTTRRYGGTGLGLALSQQLVSLMGGTIEVASTLGRGSRFTFGADFEVAQAPLPPPDLEPTALDGPRRPVLVVDDNPINLKVAMSLVEKAGFRAEGAVNGRVALEAVKRQRYALVLMDCHMPEMDGFEATEHIRALGGESGRTPIVALTASAMPDELAACRRVGMNSVLTKPVTFAGLCEVLRSQATGAAQEPNIT